MAHTFVSQVSLHSWLIWPTVRRSHGGDFPLAPMPSVLQQIGLGSLCSCFARNAQLDLVGAAIGPAELL